MAAAGLRATPMCQGWRNAVPGVPSWRTRVGTAEWNRSEIALARGMQSLAVVRRTGMRRTVVVIEDNAPIRQLFVRFLAPWGCRVLEAADGRTGLALVRSERPDLVLLDLALPEMTGREVLRRMREEPATRDVPVVMTTAQAAKEVVTEIVALGVSGYLVKPIGRSRFDDVVSTVLGTPEAARHPNAAGPSVLIAVASGRDVDAIHDALGAQCRVITATTAEEAIARHRDERPDVALIGLDLPDLGGWRVQAAIRQQGEGDAGGCIAVVPEGMRVLPGDLRAAGFHRHVTRPIDRQTLVRVVTDAARPDVRVHSHEGVPVVVIPSGAVSNATRLVAAMRTVLDGLAQDGHDRILIDVRAIPHLASGLAHVIAEAVRIGARRHMWMAAVASAATAAGLQALRETCLPCGASLQEALVALCADTPAMRGGHV